MQCRLVIGAAGEGPKVNISRTLVGKGGDPHLAENVYSVCRDGDADFLEVVRPEPGQLRIIQVLYSSEILGFVLCFTPVFLKSAKCLDGSAMMGG